MPTDDVIRIGRGSICTETPIAVGNVDGAFLAANPNRIALLISPSTVATVTISSKNPAILNQGVLLFANGQATKITIEDFGPLIQGAWRAIASAPTTISVFEITSTAQ